MNNSFNLSRAVGHGILTYFFMSIFGIFIRVTLQLNLTNGEYPASLFYSGIAASILLVGFVSSLYFKDNKVEPSARNGLNLGIVIILVSSTIELTFLMPLFFTAGFPSELIFYYRHPLFWANVVSVIATAGLVGHLLAGQRQVS